jgi:DNA-binding response OmpR family regulator
MGKKLVLVVDDEEIGLEMIASVLEADGYRVLKASDVRSAIDILESNKMTINVILMDLVMPEHSGFVAIRTIKSQKLTRLIPVMALTASTDKESVVKAMSVGADDYLTKPFEPTDLLNRVRMLCRISDFVKRWSAYAR